MSFDRVVERKDPRPTRQDKKQRTPPTDVIVPGVRISVLHHQKLPQQGQCRPTRSQAKEQQNREREFVERGHSRRHRWVEQWNFVLVLEELDCKLERLVLENAGIEEHQSYADSQPQLEDRHRKAAKPLAHAESDGSRCWMAWSLLCLRGPPCDPRNQPAGDDRRQSRAGVKGSVRLEC